MGHPTNKSTIRAPSLPDNQQQITRFNEACQKGKTANQHWSNLSMTVVELP